MKLARSRYLISTKFPHRLFLLLRSISSEPRILDSNPTTYDFNQRLAALGRRGNIEEARKLFDHMPQRDLITYSTMISLYLKNGDFPKAELLFNRLPERNVIVDSAMIDGFSKAGRIDNARKLFDAMPSRNVFSWTSLLSGYCRVGRITEARKVFGEMPVRNVFAWTTMVLGYARNGRLDEARELFDRMPERNVVSWTAMVKVLVESGRIDEAREVFDRMPNRNAYSWNVMISGYLDAGKVGQAIELFELMPERNTVSWTAMVTGLARNGCVERARKFFDRMSRKDIASWNAMITAYGEKGLVNNARELFDMMVERNAVTWNAMIDGYGKIGLREEALKLFLLMLRSPVKPNVTTLTSVLVTQQLVQEVMAIHGRAILLGFEFDTSFVNALVTMYSRSGDLGSTRLAFEELKAKDVVSWTSMILAYSYHGCSSHALQAFARMLRYGVKPDRVTFVGVLSACSHCGLVKKGQMVFDSMSQAFGLEQQAEHYSCLVDLLGRAGKVEEAKAVVSRMQPKDRDKGVLGALLGACRVHDDIDVASKVGEELIRLDQAGSGGYVLLANAYASRGMWSDAARVRKMMKERRVEKVPGISSIEVKMRSHVFCVGDRVHPQADEIYAMLDEVLVPQMKGVVGHMECIQSLDV